MRTARELVERQHRLLKRRDVAGVPELYAPGASYWMAGVSVRPGDLPALMRSYLDAFPDSDNEVTGWIESVDSVAVEQVITATHAGTGKRLRWEAAEIVRAADGRITSWRSYVDRPDVLAALGLIAPPAGAP